MDATLHLPWARLNRSSTRCRRCRRCLASSWSTRMRTRSFLHAHSIASCVPRQGEGGKSSAASLLQACFNFS